MFFFIITRRQILRQAILLMPLVLATLLTLMFSTRSLFTTADADRPLTRAASPDDRVALTFDVTWGQEELHRILAILDQNEVKATFFVGGTFLARNGDLVKQIAARGHEVGTLGQKIVDLSQLSEQAITTNLLASQSALSKALGGPVRYFRPPQGPATPEVVRAAREAKLVTVTYSIDSEDHLGRSSDQIVNRVVKRAQRGDIILLSASDFAKETSKALPRIISGLKERGFQFVVISQLVPQNLQ